MTKFNKANFSKGEYVTYRDEFSGRSRFVARFKHVPGNKAGFIKFLIANFTTEEYFGRIEKVEAPTTILESKGYVSTHILKWLRDGKLAEWKGKPASFYASQFPKVRAPKYEPMYGD